MKTLFICLTAALAGLIGAERSGAATPTPGAEALPENVAPRAAVSASSEFSDSYRAEMAVGGTAPSEFRENSDWAVRGTRTGSFALKWKEPVEAAQIVYYARVTSPLLECFKDYRVYLDDAAEPVVSGTLEHRRGPQPIGFPKQRVRKIRIEFLSSHPDSPNPGAAQIAVYGTPLSAKQLAALQIPPEERTPAARALRGEWLEGKLGFRKILLVKRKPLDISHVYVYHVEGFRPGGGLYVFSPDDDGGKPECLFEAGDDAMITTADLSYDGREVVFAMRSGGHIGSNPVAHIEDISRYPDEASNYQIFRINIDGSGLTQLTGGTYNNLDPCWLPDGGIAFISDRKPAYAYCYVVTSPVLYRMERDGSKHKRLSANYLMDFTPSVLDDGRIIYTRWEYVDRPACPIQSLWAINPDGTELAGFYGNRVISPGTFMDAQPIPGTGQVIAT
ncbi:MAG: hypothetical protein K9M97_14235, partial [Akkermansiaceae bacterium]|nr:hypothetical protein [Akkermansiaceae bacterium]